MIGEIITTNLGRIRGFEKDGCSVYLGIPFAKPPVGEYAFRHPLPPEHWEGVLDATHGSSNPIQGKGGFYISNNSQDCGPLFCLPVADEKNQNFCCNY